MRRGLLAILLLGIAVVAFAVRSVGVAKVFLGDGEVVLDRADASYNARRALFSFVNFPAVLVWDPYLAYPDGAAVPTPPLHDWALAATARALGGTVGVFERVAAWSSPVLAALTVIPVYAVGRSVGGWGIGLGAASLFAVLPASVVFSGVGNPDHHAAQALLGAVFLALSLQGLRQGTSRGRLAGIAIGLAVIRAALILSWRGSLLYILLGDGVLLGVGLVVGRGSVFAAQALGALGTLLLIAPWLAIVDAQVGVGFSATTLSWLHGMTVAGVAAVSGSLAGLERLRPSRSVPVRLGRAAGLAVAVLVAVLALPGPRQALGPVLFFFATADVWGSTNLEQAPLFGWLGGRAGDTRDLALRLYGLYGYAIPLTVVAALLRMRQPAVREPALCLAGWSLCLGTLATLQMRFGNDFAPPASVGFALLLGELRTGLRPRLTGVGASCLVLVLGAGLLWPGLSLTYLRALPGSIAFLRGAPPPADVLLDGAQALVRFAHSIRSATPDTSGYFDPQQTPEYGILCYPNHGNVLHYVARRATPADNFGPYLDAHKFDASIRFFGATSEAAAVEIAQALSARYVLSFDHHLLEPSLLLYRLHREDGSGQGEFGHVGRFRLVTEGPPGGQPLRTSFPFGLPQRPVIPYKLFEVVTGAVLELPAAPGAEVQAELALESPIGRRFEFRASGRADADGRVRLRVPYATEKGEGTRALGPYRVRVGDRNLRARVTDGDVRQGSVVRVGGPA